MYNKNNKGNQNKIYGQILSKKTITDQQLSQLCSDNHIRSFHNITNTINGISNNMNTNLKSSSNLLFIINKNNKLHQLSKRQYQPQNNKSLSVHNNIINGINTKNINKKLTLMNNTKKISQLSTKPNQQQQQMNKLYEQNQKLGYRINYLNDQNNFYRISINNIQKLNHNIHKHLNHTNNTTKNKINTKSIINQNHHLLPIANNSLSQTNSNHFHSSVSNNKKLLLKSKNTNDQYNIASATQTPSSSVHVPASIGSSFSIISNKVHLKNLQMKVGNSIRKTQKLKKIYQGSISSLTKKAQQLQQQINKLVRQAQFYCIQSQLLNNIYRAELYLHWNQDWIQIENEQNNKLMNPYNMINKDKQMNELKQVIQQKDIKSLSVSSNEDNTQYYKRQSQNIYKIRNTSSKLSEQSIQYKNKQYEQHKSKSNKLSIQNNNQFQLSKEKNMEMGTKRNIFKDNETLPMAIRFLSGEFSKSKLSNSFKNNWYSTLYSKSKNNKISQLMSLTDQFDHQYRTDSYYKNDNKLNKQPNHNNNKMSLRTNNNNQFNKVNQNKKQIMTQKQLYLLPIQLIQYIIDQLQKQQIQQINKLQSLRKQQKQQRKTNQQLNSQISQLNQNKQKLKLLIEQEFSLFFVNNVNTMETMSSFNNTIKKTTLSGTNYNNKINNNKTNNNKQSQEKGVHTKSKSRTLHRASTTLLKPPSTQQPIQPSPWTSIKQRKQQADQLYLCSLYQKQLLQSIQKQDKLLQEQYKINQQYKQKIIDRNQQENKQLKVLQEQVNKCIEQVKQIKYKYKTICQAKGKNVGSNGSVASSNNIPNNTQNNN